MGHAAAGVVGAALATGRPAVAVVGDGALLMTNEINSAVKFGAPAVWVVLNDGRYGMCAQGMDALGLSADAEIPQVDFVAFARAQGARAALLEAPQRRYMRQCLPFGARPPCFQGSFCESLMAHPLQHRRAGRSDDGRTSEKHSNA